VGSVVENFPNYWKDLDLYWNYH